MEAGFDGKQQRRALTAAEQALRALGAGHPEKARQAAAKAAELDQIGFYAELADAVAPAAARLEGGDAVDDAAWDGLVAALGLGPLTGLIDELRS